MLIGGIVIAIGVALQVAQIIASVIEKKRLRDVTGDPWDGRTLEWATASPPPFYNFAIIPKVATRDAYFDIKQQNNLVQPKYEDIHMPKNTGAGIYVSIFAFITCFAFVWHINWMAVAGIVGMIVCLIARTFNDETEYVLTAAEVEKIEETRKRHAAKQDASDDDDDMTLWQLIKVVLNWAWDVVRNKRWRTW
jgi:cytochrome o ubiquinol oxidase subunit 1